MANKICKGCLIGKNIKDYYTEGSSLCKVCRNSGVRIGKRAENKELEDLGKARCIDCLEIQGLENFTKRGYRCRACTKVDRVKKLKKVNPDYKPQVQKDLTPSNIQNKICSCCFQELLREDFYKDSSAPDKLSYHCKLCVKSKVKDYQAENKESISAVGRQKYQERKENDPTKHQERLSQNKLNYLENKESRRITARLWVENNPDKVQACKMRYSKKHRKRLNKESAEYRKQHRPKYAFLSTKRRASKSKAMPKWLTKEDIEFMEMCYVVRDQMSELHGEIFHVDHIVPLQGKRVCGLHVPWNLRIVSKDVNLTKGSKLEPALSLYLGADWYLKNQKGFNENNMY